jgi:hypothetical protein
MGDAEKILSVDAAKVKALHSLTQPWRYRLVFATCILLSIGGILWGIHVNIAAAAQRGGALATMFAFVNLLLRPDYGLLIYNEFKAAIKSDDLPTRIKEQLAALELSMAINADGQEKQNRWIAGSTAVGTIFWGFGDVFASWFHKFPPC